LHNETTYGWFFTHRYGLAPYITTIVNFMEEMIQGLLSPNPSH